jgi:SAM-dependent methyltransferase
MDENADQRVFWNSQPGQNWLANQADLVALHAGVSDLLLAETAPAPGERILDVGCGASASTLAFADAVGPKGFVTGLDISEPLLARAAERTRDAGLGNVAFVLADAAHHRFTDAYDAIVSRFGLRFFADPVSAFRNLATALRPGGRIVFAAWTAADRNPWFTLPLAAAEARLGPGAPTPPDAPGPMAFHDIARVVGILEAAGFAEARGLARTVDLHHPGGLDAATGLAGRIGPAMRHIRDKGGSDADTRAIATGLRDAFGRFVTPDGIRVPAEVNLFRARRR